MGPIAGAIIVVVVLFFVLGGDDMITKIFANKAEVARERRLEAEARAEEARHAAAAIHGREP